MHLTCEQFDLAAFLEGKCTADQVLQLEQHLESCAECQQRLEDSSASLGFRDQLRETLSDPELMVPPLPPLRLSVRNARDVQPKVEQQDLPVLRWWFQPSEDRDCLGLVDQYAVQRVVGRGGMGLVLEAVDLDLGRSVALKTLLQPIALDAVARERLLREAAAAASLKHPNIIPIYSIRQWREVPYIVMPLVSGGTLLQWQKQAGPFLRQQVMDVGLQLSSALQAAHQQGLVHRDIKPSNILIDDGLEHVMLTDFGLARMVNDHTLTMTGAVAGTPSFMSPEQALGQAVDHRSDLFSLGCVLYWMATGASPFEGENHFESLDRLLHRKVRPVSRVNPAMGQALSGLIDQLLSKQPADRPVSAGQIHQRLQELSETEEAKAPGTRPERWVAVPMLLTLAAMLMVASVIVVTLWKNWPAELTADGASSISHRQDSGGVSRGPDIVEAEDTSGGTGGTNAGVEPAATTSGEWLTVPRNGDLVMTAPALPLDVLDRENVLQDLEQQRNVSYWLHRLAGLPIEQIPTEIWPLAAPFLEGESPQERELARILFDKNPFQEVEHDE